MIDARQHVPKLCRFVLYLLLATFLAACDRSPVNHVTIHLKYDSGWLQGPRPVQLADNLKPFVKSNQSFLWFGDFHQQVDIQGDRFLAPRIVSDVGDFPRFREFVQKLQAAKTADDELAAFVYLARYVDQFPEIIYLDAQGRNVELVSPTQDYEGPTEITFDGNKEVRHKLIQKENARVLWTAKTLKIK